MTTGDQGVWEKLVRTSVSVFLVLHDFYSEDSNANQNTRKDGYYNANKHSLFAFLIAMVAMASSK
jgi:hypothetical protein